MRSTLPSHIDVAIVGGGIIGVSTALALAKKGVRVAVFEKGTLAGEQSSRNWGWIRTVGRDPRELPLSMIANDMWAQMQARIDVGYRRTGLAYLAETDVEMSRHQAWLCSAEHTGAQGNLLSRDELARMIPKSNRPWIGALYSATDGVAEPALATAAIARLAIEAGAMVFEQCAVRGIETSAGKVSAVITEAGMVKCPSVVLAGGAWSRLFCGNNSVEFPQLKVHASVLRTSPLETGLDLAVNGFGLNRLKRFSPRLGGARIPKKCSPPLPPSSKHLRLSRASWNEMRG